jgi:cytochrome c553
MLNYVENLKMNLMKLLHICSVILFLLIYLVKTSLLLLNKKEQLAGFTKIFRIPEMIISVLFLGTGIWLMTQIPSVNTLLIIKIIVVLAAIPIAIVGFKKSNKALATLSLILIIAAYGLAEVSHKKMIAPDKELVNKNDGKEIFSSYCSKCHGQNGEARINGSANFSISTIGDAAIEKMIKAGSTLGNMPAFGSQLSEEQIHAVGQYVKTFRR